MENNIFFDIGYAIPFVFFAGIFIAGVYYVGKKLRKRRALQK